MPTLPVILAHHKPKGVVVTADDERGRATVFDTMPVEYRGVGVGVTGDGPSAWLAVGRLDMDSKGLLLFVRDGRLMDALTRPGSCQKEYEVWVRGTVTEAHVAAMVRGVDSPVGVLRAVSVVLAGGVGPKSRVRITLDEGKNRHIRRMVAALKDDKTGVALKVLELKRVRIGPLALDLPSGGWRLLTDDEVRGLLASIGWRYS